MKSWDLHEVEVSRNSPHVLDSADEGRTILLELPAGERLGEHQVHERGWLLVISGEVEISGPNGEGASGGSGLLAEFDPNERHEVSASEDSRLLLLLSPWPGEGHPSRRD